MRSKNLQKTILFGECSKVKSVIDHKNWLQNLRDEVDDKSTRKKSNIEDAIDQKKNLILPSFC